MEENLPKVVVGTLIKNRDEKIILVKSHKWKQGKVYSIPGGHIEHGETIENACKREVKEEVGLDIKLDKVLFVQEAVFPKDYYKSNKHFIFLECLCSADSERVKLDNREMQDYLWVEPKKALKLDLDPYTRKFIEKYLEGN